MYSPASERIMAKPLFEGLVFGEAGESLTVVGIGADWFYRLNDQGFLRHIPARQVDESVLRTIWGMMRGHEHEVAEQAMKMLGQADVFSAAVMKHRLEHPEAHLEEILEHGLPEETRMWMGMIGFRVVVDYHGEVVRVEQPSAPSAEGE